MRSSWVLALGSGALVSMLLVQVGPAQQQGKQAKGKAATAKTVVPDGDWPLYSRDLTSARYSPLKQINASNVATLQQAWTYRPAAPAAPPAAAPAPAADGAADGAAAAGRGGGRGAGGGRGGGGRGGGGAGLSAEVTPIVIGGIMYLPGGNRVYALEADTGKEMWTYSAPGAVANRAVGYWPGDGQNPPRVIFTTGTKMMALNANTGAVDPGFGKEGSVEIEQNWGGAPYIFRNLIILGVNNGENNAGPPGDTRTYDARTGAHLWNFRAIPQPGEPGHETWLDDGWKVRGGVNVWGWYFTVDEERNLIYMPFGSPAGNYWGGDRKGANLYSSSLVAVDANTGKYKWHFQLVHHDLWDSDLPAAPSLFDVTVNGRKIPALAVINKNALMFILNRETGEPIHGVEERPVPKGDAPGEWYSPTQPFPLKPPQLGRNSFDKAKDMVTAADTTPEHAKACQELWDKAGGYSNAGPFSPFLYHEAGTPPKSSIQFPGNGGPNWGGTAADPTLGYVYIATHDAALTGWIEKKVAGGNYGNLTEGSTLEYDRGSIGGPGPYTGFSASAGPGMPSLPCQKPPWGRLYAINANTGDIAWQVILGNQDRLPEGKQHTGNVGSAGATTTAGGLVIVPSNDSHLHAFDSKTGKELWDAKVARNINANVMTYQGKNGKQYIAAVATDSVVAYALP
jgi:quinoprotein glucose dehydrogenase